MTNNPIISNLQEILSLTKKEKDLIEANTSERLFRKKQYLLQEGDVCHHFYFVVSGCLRMYKIDEKGNLHIIKFAPEHTWITEFNSFYSEKPSKFTIDALEDTTVWQIHRNDLYELYDKAPKFNRLFRILIERTYIDLQQRILQHISSSVAERYRFFLENYPQLANRLPQTQIAAFLGITPVSLSNAKADLLRGKK